MAEVVRPSFSQKLNLHSWQAKRVSDIIERPPPPEWIWDSRIMRGTVTLLGGEAKIGKSLLIQQLMSCCAVGIPCLGRHTERIRCFGYFCEDTDERLTDRQFDICEALGISMLDFEDHYHWRSAAASDDCILVDYEFGKMRLTAEWDRLWREIEYQEVELLAIDTARAVFQGNEMLSRQVTPFMRALQKKAIDRNMAIILAAHPPTGNVRKGYTGDGAWLASARAGLSLEHPAEYDPLTNTPSDELVLRGLGANYTAGRSIDRLRRRDGVLIPDEDLRPPARTDSIAAREVMDREMLYGLIRTRNNGGKVPADWDKPGSMQRRYRATFDARTAWNDLNASFERLVVSRQIVRVRVGSECLVRPTEGMPYQDEQSWTI